MSFQFQQTSTNRPVADLQKVNAPTEDAFFYVSHPSRWGLFGDQLLPILAKLHITPGLNGVDHRGDHHGAVLAYQREGWTVIPWDAVPCVAFGKEVGQYITTYTGKFGDINVEVWRRRHQINGSAPATWDSDMEGYTKFLSSLIEAGIVKTPDPRLYDHLINTKRAEIDRMTPRAVNAPALERALALAQNQLDTLLTLQGGGQTKPKPKTKRRGVSHG